MRDPPTCRLRRALVYVVAIVVLLLVGKLVGYRAGLLSSVASISAGLFIQKVRMKEESQLYLGDRSVTFNVTDGVHEVSVYEADRVAYLKVEKNFDDRELERVLKLLSGCDSDESAVRLVRRWMKILATQSTRARPRYTPLICEINGMQDMISLTPDDNWVICHTAIITITWIG